MKLTAVLVSNPLNGSVYEFKFKQKNNDSFSLFILSLNLNGVSADPSCRKICQ